MKIFSNVPAKLIKNSSGLYENDLVGIGYKVDCLTELLTNKHFLNKCKMIALYGVWGSGKSTIFNTIMNDLEDDFTFVYFEAWKYDKDRNLSLSLMEMIADNFSKNSSFLKNVNKDLILACKSLFSFSKNLLLSTQINLYGVNVDLGSSAQKTIDELNNEKDLKSYYAYVEDFKTSFKELIENYREATGKEIVVILDDLDRCDPESTLSLLSDIKHFFTYDENVTYVCGLDKEATSSAIAMKYHSYLSPEVYLEKIFDYTIELPVSNNKRSLVEKFKSNLAEIGVNCNSDFVYLIEDFFYSVGIYNPRRIKKTLNKYCMIMIMSKEIERIKRMDFINTFEVIVDLFFIYILDYIPDIAAEIDSSYFNVMNIFKKATVIEYDTFQMNKENLSEYYNYKFIYPHESVSDSSKEELYFALSFATKTFMSSLVSNHFVEVDSYNLYRVKYFYEFSSLYSDDEEIIGRFISYASIELFRETDRMTDNKPSFIINERLSLIKKYN